MMVNKKRGEIRSNHKIFHATAGCYVIQIKWYCWAMSKIQKENVGGKIIINNHGTAKNAIIVYEQEKVLVRKKKIIDYS